MRIRYIAFVLLAATACKQSNQTPEAVRQGVIESVANRVNLAQMDVNVAAVNFKGSEAEATVEFRAKGGGPGSGIQMKYTLENQSGKWVVKGKSEGGGSPHGQGATGGQPLPSGHPPLGDSKK